MAAVLFMLFSARPMMAATAKITTLKENTKYTSWDITGNGKKDTLLLKTVTSDDEVKAYVYVNGSKVYTMPQKGYSAGMKVITLSNGKNFLNVWVDGDDVPVNDKLLRYKSGKLTSIVDFATIFGKYDSISYVSGMSVSGNKVTVKVDSMNWTLGGRTFTFTYKYSGGTLKRTSSTGKVSVSGKLTAKKSITVYKTVSGKTKAFTVKKGAKVSISNYYFKSGKLWFKVKNSSGKTGWMKAATTEGSNSESNYFVDCWYAG